MENFLLAPVLKLNFGLPAPQSIFKDPSDDIIVPLPSGLPSASSEDLLEVMNPLYDLTPPGAITAVVTEVGVIPPNSINSIPVALGRTIL